MKMDLTVTVSVIIALCAIVTPLLTNAINNRHQRKMRELELSLQGKKELNFYHRKIYEDYLKNTMRCIHCPDTESKHLYDESYALAMSYFPEDLLPTVKEINEYITTNNGMQVRNQFNNLAIDIRKLLKTM